MWRKRTISIVVIILLALSLLGCERNIDEVKQDAKKVKEYNNFIAAYNKLALSFTNLAKAVDREIDKESDFDNKFWEKFETEETKVSSNLQKINSFDFNYSDIEVIMEDIEPLVENVEKYLKLVDSFKNNNENITKNQFASMHEKIYKNVMKQSSKIVIEFDLIYNEFITKKNKG